ncbi:hypothetical protein SFUMM280S_01869 [Streptomyces fumanus]
MPDPAAEKKGQTPLVSQGEKQTLSGKMAVAYATYRAPGEAQNAQLERFGQVMQGVLRKVSSDPGAATATVQTLAQILDPSLTDKDLGAFLAALADLAKGGDYKTALLPVQDDGTLSAEAGESVVKDVLGGTAKSPDQGAVVRVSVRNATGEKDNTGGPRGAPQRRLHLPGGRHGRRHAVHLRGALRGRRRPGAGRRGRQDPRPARRLPAAKGQVPGERARGGRPRPGLRAVFLTPR